MNTLAFKGMNVLVLSNYLHLTLCFTTEL